MWDFGLKRNMAVLRIQGMRKVKLAKRYLKRLRRLKKLIKLQATVKMFV
jgi:hypothetical protein